MLKILWVVGLLALYGCLGDDPKTNGPGERAEVVPAQSADLPEPRVSTTEALDQVNITVEDISEVRHTVQPRSSDDEASVADKRTRALQASPFYREAPCQDWSGRDGDMSAACCKAVVSRYAALTLDPGGIDLGLFAATDPYLGACKVFNAEFRAAVDKIEYPEEDEGSDPPF